MPISKQFLELHAGVARRIHHSRDSMIAALACFVFKVAVKNTAPLLPPAQCRSQAFQSEQGRWRKIR